MPAHLSLNLDDGSLYLVYVHALGSDYQVTGAHGYGSYRVRRTASGRATCTCRDYTYRQAAEGGICKHGEALFQAGLFQPITLPESNRGQEPQDPDVGVDRSVPPDRAPARD